MKLFGEIDIYEIIQSARISRFAIKLILKKYHKQLVKYFREYNAEHLGCELSKQFKPAFFVDKLNFDLEPDQRIYNEIVGNLSQY